MKTISFRVNTNNIDLEHMLESVSDATCNSDNVTVNEQNLVINMIQQLIKEEDRYDREN